MENPQKVERRTKGKNKERHIYASFSYIPFLNFLPLFDKEAGDFVHFHAKQGFLIFVIEFIGVLLFFSFYLLVGAFPIVRYIFVNFFFAFYILSLAILIVMGMYGALRGEEFEIPFLGDIARKINI